MPKINVYLPDDLARGARGAVPVSAICQSALERAVREVEALRGSDQAEADPSHGPFMRFTPRARQAIALAEAEARRHQHSYVGTEHMLLGMLAEGGNLAIKVLVALDVEPDDLRRELTGSLAPPSPDSGDQSPFTPLARRALEETSKAAFGLGHNYIGCEHLLLGVLATESGLGSQVLRRMGVELKEARRAVVAALSGFVHGGSQAALPQPPEPPPTAATLDEILRRLDALERHLRVRSEDPGNRGG